MFKRMVTLALAAAACGLVGVTSWAQELYRPDVVVIKLKPEAAARIGDTKGSLATGLGSLDALHVQVGTTRFARTVPAAVPVARGGKDHSGLSRYYTVHVPPGSDVLAIVEAYAADPNVEVAEPDYIMPMYGVPNDPDYGEQWTHHFVNDKDIDTEEAWAYEVGDSTVLFGNIDSGWQYDHADLVDATWVNPGEDLDGDGEVWDPDDVNGLDDDGNGYVDDFIGYDFMTFCAGWPGEDCDGAKDNDPSDFAGHGTHVGGIVAATTSNATGVAGIAGGWRSERRPGVKVIALRAGYLAADGNGFVIMTACAEAFDYAVDHGANAINCSWGTSGTLIRDAALNAMANDVVVTKAAGNDNNEVSDVLNDLAGVLSVAALDKAGGKASFSSYGTWVEISAPGVEIYNTYSNLGSATYASLGGTSMAAPTVAGVALLLKSHHPWFSKTDIDTFLVTYVDTIDADIPPTYIGKMGSGRVNPLRILQVLSTADFEADTTWAEAPLTVNFTDVSPNAPSGPYTYSFGDGDTATLANVEHTYTAPGIYDVTFTATGPSGPHTRIRPEMIVVLQDTVEFGSVDLLPGESGDIAIRINNSHPMKEFTIPVNIVGPGTIRIQSFNETALLTGWTVQNVYNNSFFGQSAWLLRSGTSGEPLPAGGGIVANMTVQAYSTESGTVEVVDTTTLGSGHSLEAESYWVTITPQFVPGAINIIAPPCSCDCHSDPQCDGVTNVLDVVYAVGVAFRGSPDIPDSNPVCPYVTTDVNCDGLTDVLDVVRVVNVGFRGQDPATQFCDPCP